jgi:hypothetical protein
VPSLSRENAITFIIPRCARGFAGNHRAAQIKGTPPLLPALACCVRLLAMKAAPPLWSPISMKQHGPAFLIKAILSLLLVQGSLSAAQSVKPPEAAAEKINRALSAGPPSITGDATVAEIGADGRMTVLRQGTNDFTCMPGDPSGVGMPAMCADKVAMQWNSDFEHHKAKPSTTVPSH